MLVNEQSISGKINEEENLRGQLAELANCVSGGLLDPSILDSTSIHYDTKENWDTQRQLIAEKGHFYIYSNAATTQNEKGVLVFAPGIKVGDGTSYLIDMPYSVFGSDHQILTNHVENTEIHIDNEERSKWNEKVSIKVNAATGTLIVEN